MLVRTNAVSHLKMLLLGTLRCWLKFYAISRSVTFDPCFTKQPACIRFFSTRIAYYNPEKWCTGARFGVTAVFWTAAPYHLSVCSLKNYKAEVNDTVFSRQVLHCLKQSSLTYPEINWRYLVHAGTNNNLSGRVIFVEWPSVSYISI